jgi:hypothetical protein
LRASIDRLRRNPYNVPFRSFEPDRVMTFTGRPHCDRTRRRMCS